jgi:endonuclease/exonuclease/phosphatase family metal-dependent hydrolase
MKDTRIRSLIAALGTLLAALAALYGIGVAVLLALDVAVGEQLALVGILRMGMPAILAPAVFIAPACLVLRRWKPALAQVPAILAFIVYYGPYYIPRQSIAAAEIRPLVVLTYNLHAEATHLDPLIAVIREAGADVVALQELSPAAAQAFEAQLAELYPHRALHPGRDNPILGQGVLSRYPIRDDIYWRMNLAHQRVTLDVEGAPVALYNAHPPPPLTRRPEGLSYAPDRRSADIAEVLRRAAEETLPTILAGDFNMTDRTGDYAAVAARYADTFREAGWGLGLTLPDYSQPQAYANQIPLPWLPVPRLVRIDYVFHDQRFAAVASRVWPASGGSDHRPVLAHLFLSP